jgi:Tfp pilus assembly protein PilF
VLSTRKGWREFESVPSIPLREEGADRSSRWGPRGRIIVLLSVVAVAALAVFALIVLADEKTVGINAATRPLHYLITQTRVIYTYLRLLVWPYPQSLEYDFQNVGGLLLGAGIVAIFGAGWMLRSLGIVSFFILLAPTSSIIPSIDAAFEHRLYLPMLSFALLAAYVISKLPRRTWIATAVLAVFAILTLRREMVWSSDIALWQDAAQHAPGKARVWFNLGGAYLNTGGAKARESFLRALTLQPHFPEALYDLGMIEQGRKNWSGALAYYQQALAQDPTYWPACNNIGNTLFSMGEADRSVQYFERTLSLNHDYWPAQYNIAVVHFIKGRYADAVPRLQTVLDWRPDFREARYLLASSLTRAGSRNAADEEWKKLGEGSAAESRHTPTMILAPSRP